MTIAEIRGKLSSSGSNIHDRNEDLLTSDVFGCLRYLPFDEGCRAILTQAQRCFGCNADTKKLCIDPIDKDVKFHFWRRLGRSEPDVLIEHGKHLIMMEVKYLSSKSGHHEAVENDENRHGVARPDQLAREFQDLMAYGNYSKRSLIYLTAHRSLPQEDIEAGYKQLKKWNYGPLEKYKDNIYWLSWFEVYKTISELLKDSQKIQDKYQRKVLCDMQRLLRRKGFRKFEGFKGKIAECEPIAAFYKRNRGPDTWNIQPVEPTPEYVFYYRSDGDKQTL